MHKYSHIEINKKIASYPPIRARVNENHINDKICFVFYCEEDLLRDYHKIKNRFKNAIYTIIRTGWGHLNELSAKIDCNVIGYKTAETMIEYHLAIFSSETVNTRKLQIIAIEILFKGRSNYMIYSDKLPTDRLQARPNFYRQNKDEIHFIVNHLADETSVNCYLSRVKSILFGTSHYTNLSTYHQYLHPIVNPKKDDIIIEGGIGSLPNTTMLFSKYVGSKGKIYAFEPVPDMYNTALTHTKKIKNIVLEKAGIWDKKDTMDIILAADSSTLRSMSFYKDNPTVKCDLVTIDEYCKDKNIKKVNLIKMDIEGAEQNALRGASQIIQENKPKLQVCLYHSLKDFIDIPISTIEKKLDYKLYIGNHTPFMFECLMYAK